MHKELHITLQKERNNAICEVFFIERHIVGAADDASKVLARVILLAESILEVCEQVLVCKKLLSPLAPCEQQELVIREYCESTLYSQCASIECVSICLNLYVNFSI